MTQIHVSLSSDSDTMSVASTTLLSARGDEESAGRRVVLRKRWTVCCVKFWHRYKLMIIQAADGSSKQMLITDPEEVRKIQIRQQKLEILRGFVIVCSIMERLITFYSLLSKADIDFEDAV